MTFSDFIGNGGVMTSLRRMVAEDRLPQTLLFAGPRGVGKATLARLVAAALNCVERNGDVCGKCGHCLRMLQADLSTETFQEMFAERLKLPAAKRVENPLIISTHPDFLIFPPDGPLRMIGIEQARRLRAAAQFTPSEGRRRVFLIDHADRANDEAANSLLKTLEEPAAQLVVILTAENPYELLPTIRSRSIPFYFAPLSPEEMRQFLETRPDVHAEDRGRLARWAQGSPGQTLMLDVEEYTARRSSMLTLLKTSLGQASFGELLAHTEGLARKRQESMELLTASLYSLLHDLLHLHLGSREALINADIEKELQALSARISFRWVERAANWATELDRLERRNIQKQLAVEALAIGLRRPA